MCACVFIERVNTVDIVQMRIMAALLTYMCIIVYSTCVCLEAIETQDNNRNSRNTPSPESAMTSTLVCIVYNYVFVSYSVQNRDFYQPVNINTSSSSSIIIIPAQMRLLVLLLVLLKQSLLLLSLSSRLLPL